MWTWPSSNAFCGGSISYSWTNEQLAYGIYMCIHACMITKSFSQSNAAKECGCSPCRGHCQANLGLDSCSLRAIYFFHGLHIWHLCKVVHMVHHNGRWQAQMAYCSQRSHVACFKGPHGCLVGWNGLWKGILIWCLPYGSFSFVCSHACMTSVDHLGSATSDDISYIAL